MINPADFMPRNQSQSSSALKGRPEMEIVSLRFLVFKLIKSSVFLITCDRSQMNDRIMAL